MAFDRCMPIVPRLIPTLTLGWNLASNAVDVTTRPSKSNFGSGSQLCPGISAFIKCFRVSPTQVARQLMLACPNTTQHIPKYQGDIKKAIRLTRQTSCRINRNMTSIEYGLRMRTSLYGNGVRLARSKTASDLTENEQGFTGYPFFSLFLKYWNRFAFTSLLLADLFTTVRCLGQTCSLSRGQTPFKQHACCARTVTHEEVGYFV